MVKPVKEFGPIAIHQPPEVLEQMNEWCKQTFAKNGLIERIKRSETGEKETENMVIGSSFKRALCYFNPFSKVLTFLREHIPPGECPLAGNSVHADREFLKVKEEINVH